MMKTDIERPIGGAESQVVLEELVFPKVYGLERVLVIGGAGFVGRHLVQMLVKAGAEVTVLDNYSRGNVVERLRGSSANGRAVEGAEYNYGDCSHEGTCRDRMKSADFVFNLAATVAGVIWNQSHHVEMFTKNIQAQMVPMKIADEYGVDRYLCVSSVCVYAPGYNDPALEINGFKGLPTPANIGYAMAKRMGEMMAVWHAKESGLGTVVVRPSNVFGPYDYFDEKAHVIPALIEKCLEEDEIVVNGTGQEYREFIYVEDVARGMMAALARGEAGEVYNLGTSGRTACTIEHLLELIQLECGTEKPVAFSSQFDPGDDRRWSDASKAEQELSWTHDVTLQEGLRRTIEWYTGEPNETAI